MKRIKKFDWKYFKNYVETYDPKKHAMNDATIIFLDMLYGLGVSVDKTYTYANGFDKFKEFLLETINKEINLAYQMKKKREE